MKKIKILLFIIFIAIVTLFGVDYYKNQMSKKNNLQNDLLNYNNVTNSIEDEQEVRINRIIDSMSEEEKVGQLFVCAFRKDSKGNNIYNLNDDVRKNITEYSLGGVIFFAENIKNEDQVKNYINDLNSINKNIPLFISIDCEGGVVDRLADTTIVSRLPNISILGATNNTSISYQYAKIIGRRLASLGFNLDFAPVCDLDNSDAIKNRSFGKDPNYVGNMIENYIKGLNEFEIGSTLKHFPGIGSSVGDTHKVISSSEATLEELKSSDFIPFEYGIKVGANLIMMSHVEYDKISDLALPASLNSDMYKILRENLNYNGIIITDGLEMKAVTEKQLNRTPAYNAFVAGADMLLLPENIDTSYNEILDDVKSGKISKKRLDESVKRIITYKDNLKLFQKNQANYELIDKNDQKIIDEINNK